MRGQSTFFHQAQINFDKAKKKEFRKNFLIKMTPKNFKAARKMCLLEDNRFFTFFVVVKAFFCFNL